MEHKKQIITHSSIASRAFEEANSALCKAEDDGDAQIENELLFDLGIVDPIKHKGFVISVVFTVLLVVIGWGYFFSRQVSALATSIPQARKSPYITNFIDGMSDVTASTADGINTKVVSGLGGVYEDVKQKAEVTVILGNVLDQMTEEIKK